MKNDHEESCMALQEAIRRGDTDHVDLWYPGVEDNPEYLQIGLMHVRAADDIRIHYDFERDGYVIEQASTFRWDINDRECDPDWQEVAFIKAWAREKGSGSS
jgi:hypothetical protein